jgi:hypothetical protein
MPGHPPTCSKAPQDDALLEIDRRLSLADTCRKGSRDVEPVPALSRLRAKPIRSHSARASRTRSPLPTRKRSVAIERRLGRSDDLPEFSVVELAQSPHDACFGRTPPMTTEGQVRIVQVVQRDGRSSKWGPGGSRTTGAGDSPGEIVSARAPLAFVLAKSEDLGRGGSAARRRWLRLLPPTQRAQDGGAVPRRDPPPLSGIGDPFTARPRRIERCAADDPSRDVLVRSVLRSRATSAMPSRVSS